MIHQVPPPIQIDGAFLHEMKLLPIVKTKVLFFRRPSFFNICLGLKYSNRKMFRHSYSYYMKVKVIFTEIQEYGLYLRINNKSVI